MIPKSDADNMPEDPRSSGTRPTVLVLDDDPLIRWSLGNALEKVGVRVKALASGEEALKLLETMEFAAIITDLELPHVNGFAVTAEGRRRAKEVPVILLTASGDEASRAKASALGINYFVDKPFDLEEIVCLVKNLIPGEP